MKLRHRALVIIIAALTVMCTVRTAPVRTGMEPTDAGYDGPREVAYYYTEGIKRSAVHGDHIGAARYFDKAIETDSTHAPSYFAAANNIAGPDPMLALEYSREANRLDSLNPWYRSQLGRLMVYNGFYGEALDTYKELVDKFPHDPDNYRMLAALYEFTGHPFDAVALLDSAEYKFGMLPELVNFKRELLVKLRLYDKAIAETNDLIAIYPYMYENYMVLGELYSLTGKDSLAMENFRIAQGINPGAIDLLVALNEYYQRKGDDLNYLATAKQIFQSDDIPLDTKIRFFNDITSDREYYGRFFFQISDLAYTLLLKYPGNYQVLEIYSGNLIASGNIEEALRMYKSFLGATADNIGPYNNIVEIEAYLGRSDSVDKYSAMALASFPGDANLYIRRGYALSYMDRNREAVSSFESALKYADTDSVRSIVYGALGDTYHEIGEARKCYANYEKALQLDPDNIVVLNNYAYFLILEDREQEKALAMAERVMELSPGNPTYLDTYGWVLYKLGRYEQARQALRQAISLDRSQSKELLLHYGDILHALGEDFMATVYWNKALEAGYDPQEIERRLSSVEK